MATIYPIAMDLSTDFGVTVNITSETPYIAISFAQYEDYDAVNGTWSNQYSYSYWFALASFSYTSINDTVTGEYLNVSFHGPNVTLQFSSGQIADLAGNPLNLGNLLAEVTSALPVL
jgi:hypothetical protein